MATTPQTPLVKWAVIACFWPLILVNAAEAEEEPVAACTPHLVEDKIVVTAEQRKDASSRVRPNGVVGPTGFDWTDTTLGIVKSRDKLHYLFFGSDGSCHKDCNTANERDGSFTRVEGTLDNPLAEAGHDVKISEFNLPTDNYLPPFMLYVGGGQVYRVPEGETGGGNLIMLYYPARATYQPGHHYPDCNSSGYCNGDQQADWNYLGLASSRDDGETWQDLGLIISANQPYLADSAATPYDDGGNSNLLVYTDNDGEKYFVVQFRDLIKSSVPGGNPLPTSLSYARVSYAALLDAVARMKPEPKPKEHALSKELSFPPQSKLPPFHKYYNGKWEEPGLGGLSSDIRANLPGYNVAIAWNNAIHRWVGFFGDDVNIYYSESSDLFNWSKLVSLPTKNNKSDYDTQIALYITPVGKGDDPSVLDDSYYFYYLSQNDYCSYTLNGHVHNQTCGWDSAVLRRVEIECKQKPKN